MRVLSRNTNDANPVFRISPTLSIGTAAGTQALTSRFVASKKNGNVGGIKIRGGSIGAASAGGSFPSVRAPR